MGFNSTGRIAFQHHLVTPCETLVHEQNANCILTLTLQESGHAGTCYLLSSLEFAVSFSLRNSRGKVKAPKTEECHIFSITICHFQRHYSTVEWFISQMVLCKLSLERCFKERKKDNFMFICLQVA